MLKAFPPISRIDCLSRTQVTGGGHTHQNKGGKRDVIAGYPIKHSFASSFICVLAVATISATSQYNWVPKNEPIRRSSSGESSVKETTTMEILLHANLYYPKLPNVLSNAETNKMGFPTLPSTLCFSVGSTTNKLKRDLGNPLFKWTITKLKRNTKPNPT